MTDFVLEADLREKTGKAETRRLRRAGLVPAIIYGGDKQDLPIVLDFNTIINMMKDEHFFTSMLEINVKGSRGKNTVLLRTPSGIRSMTLRSISISCALAHLTPYTSKFLL